MQKKISAKYLIETDTFRGHKRGKMNITKLYYM